MDIKHFFLFVDAPLLKTKFQYKKGCPGHCSAQLSINLRRVKSSREVSAFEFCAGKLLRRVVQIPESKTAIFLVFSTRRYSEVQFNMSKKLNVIKIAFFCFYSFKFGFCRALLFELGRRSILSAEQFQLRR